MDSSICEYQSQWASVAGIGINNLAHCVRDNKSQAFAKEIAKTDENGRMYIQRWAQGSTHQCVCIPEIVINVDAGDRHR